MLVQSIFYPVEMFAKRRRGISLRPAIEGRQYRGEPNGEVNEIDCGAIIDGNQLHVFATNRNLSDPATVRVALADRGIVRAGEAEIHTGPGAKAENSFDDPGVVRSVPFGGVEIESGKALLTMPPLSFAAVTFELG